MNRQLILKLIDFIVYSHVFLAICVVGFYQANNLLLNNELRVDHYSCFIFFATISLYNFHRLYTIKRFDLPNAKRYLWVEKNKKIAQVVLCISILICIIFAIVSIPTQHYIYMGLICLVAFGYTVPVLPFFKSRLRLRDFALIKPMFIAIVIIAVTLLYPQFKSCESLVDKSTFFIITLIQFLFILSSTILCDMRDMQIDDKQQLKTIVVKYGFGTAKNLAGLFCVIAILFLLYLNVSEPKSAALLSPLLIILLILLIVTYRIKKKNNELYYLLTVDGLMLLQFLLSFFMKMF